MPGFGYFLVPVNGLTFLMSSIHTFLIVISPYYFSFSSPIKYCWQRIGAGLRELQQKVCNYKLFVTLRTKHCGLT